MLRTHNDVMTWKRQPHYRSFVGKSISHRWIPPQRANNVERWCFLCCRIENECLCDAFSWHAISCCHGDAAILLTAKYGFIALWWILAVHSVWYLWYVNSLRPRQNDRYFADDIFKCIFFSMKIYEFRLRFHWSLFLRFELTIFQHWFTEWLGAGQATSHYLNQCWLVYRHIYASLGLNELSVDVSEAGI